MPSGAQFTPDPARLAYEKVVAGAGASLPRDAVDRRLIDDLTSLGRRGQTVRDRRRWGALARSRADPHRLTPTATGCRISGKRPTRLIPKLADGNQLAASGYTQLEEVSELAGGATRSCRDDLSADSGRAIQAELGIAGPSISAPTGSATRSSASGRTGGRRPCRWTATGMPAACTSRATAHYKYHLEHYGHPSDFGYKDIIPLWKAEKWDPDRLMALYKKAGAKYFVSMGSHHDNFFLWNSKLHRWNAVNMGPHRDVVGEWQKAAQKYGLRFGVSEHLGASFTWFQSSHRADKTGPKAGVPYDGADPQVPGPLSFPRRARRQRLVQQQSHVAAAVVRRNQGTGGQLSSRPALHRRRRAVRQ